MKQRLIDANALKESFRKQTVNVQGKIKDDADAIIEAICKDVDLAPTVDAVPVVRCAECKNWLERLIRTDNDGERYSRCCLNGVAVGESFYCADGERKDGEHE